MLGSLNISLQYLTKEIEMQVIVNIAPTEDSVALPSNFNHMNVLWAVMLSDSCRFHLQEGKMDPWTYVDWVREGKRLVLERYALLSPTPEVADRAAHSVAVWLCTGDQVNDLIDTFAPPPGANHVDIAEAYAAAIPVARLIFGRMCRRFINEEMGLV